MRRSEQPLCAFDRVRGVKLYVALAVIEGVASTVLDDPNAMRAALDAGVTAGGFWLREMLVARFEPHGVTATAVVGESHLCLHSWPEEGRLFVDIASCSTREGVRRAMDAIVESLPGAQVTVLDERELSEKGVTGR